MAVAEMATGAGRSSAFALQTIDGVAYVSLAPQRSVSSAASTSLLKKCISKDYAALLDYEGEVDASFVAKRRAPLCAVRLWLNTKARKSCRNAAACCTSPLRVRRKPWWLP